MVEHDQMLAPEMVERLQQDRLLDVAHDVGAPLRDLRRHVLVGAALDAGEDLLVGDAFFLGPFVDRQIEAEHALELFLAGRPCPIAPDRRFPARAWRPDRRSTSWRMSATISADGLVAHQFDALVEDHLALVVHHVVELEQVLADVEVARLDLLLRLLQRLVDPGMDDRLVLLAGRACCSMPSSLSEPKMRIRSSSSDRKNFEWPGSPWRPERPRS